MGDARRRKGRFLTAHPICCFCGGGTRATTVDHIPSKDCFKGRAFPEGFEFPACARCQGQMRSDEQIFSFVVQMSDRNAANYDREKSRRSIRGIKNNHPHLLPQVLDDPSEKFRALRHLGQPFPLLTPAREIPIVALPPDICEHIQRVAKKLALALYYKERGRIAAASHRIWSSWCFATDLRTMTSFSEVARMTRFQTVGWRHNLDFGDQFSYRWDCQEKGEPHDLFMLVAQFGEGLVIAANLIDDTAFQTLDETDALDEWEMVGSLFGELDRAA